MASASSRIALAHLIALIGPSKVAQIARSVASLTRPLNQSISRRASSVRRSPSLSSLTGITYNTVARTLSTSVERFDEILNFGQDAFLIPCEQQMILARQFYKLRTGYSSRNVATFFYVCISIVGSVHQERGDFNRRQHMTHINRGIHPSESQGCFWSRTSPLITCPPLPKVFIMRFAWR